MYEIAEAVLAWQQAGEHFVVTRAVAVAGFGRAWRSEAFALSATGQRCGSILAGVTQTAVEATAAELLTGGDSTAVRLLHVAVPDSDAEATGLICGGTATLLLQREGCLPDVLWPLLAAAGSGVLFTTLDEPVPGRCLLVAPPQARGGSLGDPALDDAAEQQAGMLLRTGRFISETREIAGRGLHAAVLLPVPELVIVGDGHLAEALGRMAAQLDWDVELRTDAGDLGRLESSAASAAVVVLSHDLALAAPALAAALASKAGYVGAVGSRKTQAGRAERLRSMGISEQDLGRIHGPAGLDLGARTPAEIALSICAEILAEREGRSRTPLSRLRGPIHQPDPAAG